MLREGPPGTKPMNFPKGEFPTTRTSLPPFLPNVISSCFPVRFKLLTRVESARGGVLATPLA